MVSREPLLLILAADRREFQSFASAGWDLAPCSLGLRWSAIASLGNHDVLLAAHGPGRRNAAEAVERAAERVQLGAVVSTGFAGALNPALRVGDVLIVQQVIQFEGRLEYAVRLPSYGVRRGEQVGSLLTVDEVAQDAAFKARLRSTGADAVDMEASAVAAEALRRKLPFYCVRSISDEAETSFEIDFNRARRRDGTFSGWRVLAQAGINPGRWRQLMSLRRDSLSASHALGAFLRQCTFEF